MPRITRRTFAKQALGSIAVCSHLGANIGDSFAAQKIARGLEKLFLEINPLCSAVKSQEISQVEWQIRIQEALQNCNFRELTASIDIDGLKSPLNSEHNATETVSIGTKLGFQSLGFEFWSDPAFRAEVVLLQKDTEITPHGHDNMVTALLVLEGRLQVQRYDRIKDEKSSLILKPRLNGLLHPGECSTTSEYRNNVHCLQAKGGDVHFLSFVVEGVAPTREPCSGRVLIDLPGQPLTRGFVRAPRILDQN